MKKLQQVVGVLLLLGASVMFSSPGASAVSSCPNGYTGPNSDNICTSVTTYQCTQTNDNTVTITQDGTQVSMSGEATSGGNGNGESGGAQTGSATNTNGVSYDVVLSNEGVCTATATTPATPVPEVKAPAPVASGKGAIAAPDVPKPAVLATTSGNPALGYVTGGLVVLVIIAGAARVATLAYASKK